MARRFRASVVVGIANLSVLAACIGQAAAQTSASELLRTALANAGARGSVHETISLAYKGRRGSMSDDVASHSGRQDISMSDGVRAHILVIDHVAYTSGNQKALISYYGIPRTVARVVGSRWVSIPSSSTSAIIAADYASAAANVTLPSALAQITPSGRLTELPVTRIDGKAVIGIRGGVPTSVVQAVDAVHHKTIILGRETIYITRSHPLPVRATLTTSGTSSSFAHSTVTTLTGWGERVALTPPKNSIPISRLSSLGQTKRPPPGESLQD